MQRYFLEQPFTTEGTAVISGDDEKHISRVMRMEIGDQLIAVSDGTAYLSTIQELTSDGVHIVKEGETLPSNEMPILVTLACGLPKGDKLEYIVQKGTELGMAGLIPFQAERSIVKWDAKKSGKKEERLRKIAKEAAEQCHRSSIPAIHPVMTRKELLQTARNFDVLLFADEEEAKTDIPRKIADRLKNMYHKQTVLVLFGPEGGLSREEAKELSSAGFLPIALGPRILRTETAPLYVLSAMSYEFE